MIYMDNHLTTLLRRIGIEGDSVGILYWLVVLLGVILLIYCSRFLCSRIVIPFVRVLTQKTASRWDDVLLNDRTLKSICNLIVALAFIALIPLIFNNEGIIYLFAIKLCWVYLTIITVQLACNLFTAFNQISSEAEKTRNHTLQGVFQMLKIVAICIGAIIVASIIIDKDPMKLLAGLGASAAVLMLVFKDSIMGLVAGVQLSANDMLRPGDWITMPKYGADGCVIDVTLTTVKVRNWDNTISTIPPYALVSDSFQNWRGMWDSGGRRIKRSIFIDMNSIAFCSEKQKERLIANGYLKEYKNGKIVNLTAFREWLEEWIRNHPSVNKDMVTMVRQLQPTQQGLPLELYFFFNGINWVPYEHLQSEIFEYVLATIPEFGLRAFQAPAGSDFTNNSRIPLHLY
ncbi:MAG: mechanosensitive ion channel family protein [Bacteroidaceae bacterium]|nr:mechanosensitive ion channel family protein [Bacteroidaceae bacterium]